MRAEAAGELAGWLWAVAELGWLGSAVVGKREAVAAGEVARVVVVSGEGAPAAARVVVVGGE